MTRDEGKKIPQIGYKGKSNFKSALKQAAKEVKEEPVYKFESPSHDGGKPFHHAKGRSPENRDLAYFAGMAENDAAYEEEIRRQPGLASPYRYTSSEVERQSGLEYNTPQNAEAKNKKRQRSPGQEPHGSPEMQNPGEVDASAISPAKALTRKIDAQIDRLTRRSLNSEIDIGQLRNDDPEALNKKLAERAQRKEDEECPCRVDPTKKCAYKGCASKKRE